MSYFDNDDWQPAEWLSAIERLAPAPAPEQIPVSSKMLDAATERRVDVNTLAETGERVLLWHKSGNWVIAQINTLHDGTLEWIAEGLCSVHFPYLESHYWRSLPPALEVQE